MTLLTYALLLFSWRSLPRTVRPSLRWWLGGLLLEAVGFMLFALRGTVPDWISIVAANTFISFGLSCTAISLRSFYGMPVRRRELFGLSALTGLLALALTSVQPNPHWRVVGLALLTALLTGSSASAVFRHKRAVDEVARLTGLLFVLATLGILARAGQEAFWPAWVSDPISGSPSNLPFLGVLLLLPVLSTVGFLLMCTERGQQQLESAARTDYLTGIFNRRAIEDLAARAISAARRHGAPLSVVSLDVDHFKRVNDQYGHEAGDNALIEVVRRMREIMRAEDLVGRQGGEEFVVLMPDIGLDNARRAAERLRASFEDRPLLISDGERRVGVSLTVSVGVATLEPADQQFSHLLRRADRAMYAAKAAGRNRVMLDSGPA